MAIRGAASEDGVGAKSHHHRSKSHMSRTSRMAPHARVMREEGKGDGLDHASNASHRHSAVPFG